MRRKGDFSPINSCPNLKLIESAILQFILGSGDEMFNSIRSTIINSWKRLIDCARRRQAITTLTLYIKDTEHEKLAVITALKAHMDLLHDEHLRNSISTDRFLILNRSIFRLITDIESLSLVAALATKPESIQRLLVKNLIEETTLELQSELDTKGVTISLDIEERMTVKGDLIQTKHIFTQILIAILNECKNSDTIKVEGCSDKKRVSLTFSVGILAGESEFLPWRLGELHLIPMNGEGINLATVDAMARLQDGWLSVSNFMTDRKAYKLVFDS